MEKVTVITVCYNAEEYIENTMRSVLNQNYEDMEYVIVDGNSADRTLSIIKDVLREYPNKQCEVISEKDSGIYDAMNKGVRVAAGEWILFMNAGDSFCKNDTVSKLFAVDNIDAYDGIYGDTIRVKNGKQLYVAAMPLEKIETGIPLPFCHQSVFVKKDWLIKYPFDLNYRQAGDYNFFAHLYLEKCKFYYCSIPVSVYLMGGVSEKNNILHLCEKIKIRENLGLQKYSEIEKRKMINRLRIRARIKKIIPRVILERMQGFR